MSLEGLLAFIGILIAIIAVARPVQRRSLTMVVQLWHCELRCHHCRGFGARIWWWCLSRLPARPTGRARPSSASYRRRGRTKKHCTLRFRIISNTVTSRLVREHLAERGIPLLKTCVANRISFSEALTMGKSIFEWAPRSAAAREFTAVMEEIGAFYGQERPDEAPAKRQVTAKNRESNELSLRFPRQNPEFQKAAQSGPFRDCRRRPRSGPRGNSTSAVLGG